MPGVYGNFLKLAVDGDIDLLVNDIRAVLVAPSLYTPNYDTHVFLSDVPVGARQGTPQVLGTKTTTRSAGAVTFDAADIVFPNVAVAAAVDHVALYRFVTTDADSPLVAMIAITSTTPNGQNITVTWDNGTNKIIRIG